MTEARTRKPSPRAEPALAEPLLESPTDCTGPLLARIDANGWMVIMGQLAIYAYECGSSRSEGVGGGMWVGIGVGANDTKVLANGVHKLRTKPVIEGGGPQGVGVWESAQRWAGRSVLK